MDTSLPVAVLGATGVQGGAVARAVLRSGQPLRAIARSEPTLRASFGDEVDVRAVDVTDLTALAAALEGVAAAFVHVPLTRGLFGPAVAEAGRAMADAVARARVPLTVYTTSGTPAPDGGSSAQFNAIGEAEQAMLSSGVPVISLRPAGYLANLALPDSALAVLGGTLAYPLLAEFRYRWVSAEDQARLVLEAWKRPELAGRAFAIGERLSGHELAAAIGRGLGREVRYLALSVEQFAAALTPTLGAMAQPIADDYRHIVEDTEALGLDADPGELLSILGARLTPVEDWARAQDWRAAGAPAGAAA